jgi:hypothetical protein
MSPYRCSALFASAALVLGATLAPAVAFADSTDPASGAITHDDLVAALTAAHTATATAAKAGWVAQGTATEAGSPAEAMKAIYAVDRALASGADLGTLVQAQHSGTYMTLSSFDGLLPVRPALKALAKPHATWVFVPEKSLDLRSRDGDSVIAGIAPDGLLADLVDPEKTRLADTATKATAGDGSATYTFFQTDLTGDGTSGTDTLTVNADGKLTAVKTVASAETDTATFTYGTQHVALPTASQTVTLDQLTQGVVLAALPRETKAIAKQVAKAATRHAHKKPVKAAVLRSTAKKIAKGFDRTLGLRIFSTKPITGGVRIIGTNPYRHTRVSYKVTAAGKKAVVHKG